MASRAQRAHLARLMDLLVQQEPRVHYAEVRPMQTRHIATDAQLAAVVRSPAGVTMDCSESVTLLCRLAGLADPNGLDYNGTGYTGTLLQGPCRHYSNPSAANIGALVVFGEGDGHHVCMVRRPGRNPLLFSHGQERGPLYISLNEEARYQPRPATFLSIAKL